MKEIFMKRSVNGFLVLSVAAAALLSCGPRQKAVTGVKTSDESDAAADCIITGNIITMNPYRPCAEAITVKDGLVQFVGSEKVARALCDDGTVVLDYGDNYVYPGFLEAHAHGAGGGYRLAGQADLNAGKSVEDYQKTMKEWAESHPDKKILTGSGWKPWLVAEPTKADLDAICPDRPMMVASVDGHSMWVNSCLMEQQKIDRDYAVKMGPAQVHVDADGNPTGVLTEGATTPLMRLEEITQDDFKEYILAWQGFSFAKGYTATTEAGVEMAGDGAKQAYSDLGKEGKLKLRTYAYHLVADDSDAPEEDVAAALEDIRLYNNEYFKVIGMKVFIDGVIEAHTGWMLSDYLDQSGYHGLERYSDHDVAVRLLEEAGKNGLSVHAHTIGNGAVRFMMDAIEESALKTGNFDQRNILVHLQIVDPEDIARFADYNVISGTAPLWVPKVGDVYRQECAYVGEEAARKAYPIRSFIDAGVVNVSHTDYPVSTEMSIPSTFYKGVLRAGPKDPAGSLRGPEEAVSRMDILKSLTVNVAYQWREEDRLGSLEVGKIANATVFDKDFLNDPMEEVINARLIATIVDGEVVYGEE